MYRRSQANNWIPLRDPSGCVVLYCNKFTGQTCTSLTRMSANDGYLPPPPPPPPPEEMSDATSEHDFETMRNRLSMQLKPYGFSTEYGEESLGASGYQQNKPSNTQNYVPGYDYQEDNKSHRSKGKKYVAKHSFKKRDDDELSFKEEEILIECNSDHLYADKNFIVVRNTDGKVGLAPIDYLEVYTRKPLSAPMSPQRKPMSRVAPHLKKKQLDSSDDEDDDDEFDDDGCTNTTKEFEDFCKEQKIANDTREKLIEHEMADLDELGNTNTQDLIAIGIKLRETKIIESWRKTRNMKSAHIPVKKERPNVDKKMNNSCSGENGPTYEDLHRASKTVQKYFLGYETDLLKERKGQMCMFGNKLVEWTVNQQNVTPEIAVAMWQALVEVELLAHVEEKYQFEDKKYFYQFVEEETKPKLPEKKECKKKLPNALDVLENTAAAVLKRNTLHKTSSERTGKDIMQIVDLIKNLKAFEEFNLVLNDVARVLMIKTYIEPTEVFKKGQPADFWYVILNGKVKEKVKGKTINLMTGDDFGKPDQGAKRQTQADVDSEICHLLKIQKDDYISLKKMAQEENAKPKPRSDKEKFDDIVSQLSEKTRQRLQENEYENLEDLQSATKQDFIDTGIPIAQVNKLMRLLQTLEEEDAAIESSKVERKDKKPVDRRPKSLANEYKDEAEEEEEEEDSEALINENKVGGSAVYSDAEEEEEKPPSKVKSNLKKYETEANAKKEKERVKKPGFFSGSLLRFSSQKKDKNQSSEKQFYAIAGEDRGVIAYVKRLIGIGKAPTTKKMEHFTVYKLPVNEEYSDEDSKIRICNIGSAKMNFNQSKNILLVGQTGSGKSTMIEGMVNYLYRISFKDPYRLNLIDLKDCEKSKSSAESQTDWITAYTIPPSEYTIVDYPITIVDMPGFGDTRGLQNDEALVRSLKKLFQTEGIGGIATIDAVCFVAKATDVRLTPEQHYIFNSILNIFGHDIKENIHALITFVDNPDAQPKVITALNEADVPYENAFQFNNDAVYPRNMNVFNEMYWEMGSKGYREFFDHLENAVPKSVYLTNQTLLTRAEMLDKVKSLEKKVQATMTKIEENDQLEEQLSQKMTEKWNNEGFSVTIPKEIYEKVPTEPGSYVIYCIECDHECHPDSPIGNDEDIENSVLMDDDGNCEACRNHCPWDEHQSRNYSLRKTRIMIKQFSSEKKEIYERAKQSIVEIESRLDPIRNKKNQLVKEVHSLTAQITECMETLRKIALKKQPATKLDYLKRLLQDQLDQRGEGWEGKKAMLEEMIAREEIITKVAKGKDVTARQDI